MEDDRRAAGLALMRKLHAETVRAIEDGSVTQTEAVAALNTIMSRMVEGLPTAEARERMRNAIVEFHTYGKPMGEDGK